MNIVDAFKSAQAVAGSDYYAVKLAGAELHVDCNSGRITKAVNGEPFVLTGIAVLSDAWQPVTKAP